MRQRFIGLLIAVPTLLVGVLTAVPAEAASFYLFVKTTNVAIDAAGNGQVYVQCNATVTCKGRAAFTEDASSNEDLPDRKYNYFSVPAKTTAYIKVGMYTDAPVNPNSNPNDTVGDLKVRRNAELLVQESAPKGTVATHYYPTMTAEEKISERQISGNVQAATGSANVTDMTVRLFSPVRGGNVEQRDAVDVQPGGNFTFRAPFGPNNVAAYTYTMQIEAKVDGQVRSWWWRGTNGTSTGGGRYIRDASDIKASKTGDFRADFRYGFISGRIADAAYQKAGVDVSVASPPPSFSGAASDLRELDLERCANVFGQTRTDSTGRYRVDFLPATTSTDNRYMVGARTEFGSSTFELWRGATTEPFGSCYDATDYKNTRDKLLTLNPGVGRAGIDVALHLPRNKGRVPVRTEGFTPTAADQWIRIREKVPGIAVTDMPIVAETQGKVGTITDLDLPPGIFLVETGRFTGDTGKPSTENPKMAPCSGWQKSVFTDNNLYFKGAERAAERWKTVNGTAEETTTSVRNGYVRASPGSGYKGWMYRNYCKSLSAGTFNNVIQFSGENNEYLVPTTTAKRGGVVYGKVKRNGGRTPKEMMVRVSNSSGTYVARYDVADSSGNFYVAGLAPGNYSISVNPDSWRGIDRSFLGKHSVTVPGGGNYSVGTLVFRG